MTESITDADLDRIELCTKPGGSGWWSDDTIVALVAALRTARSERAEALLACKSLGQWNDMQDKAMQRAKEQFAELSAEKLRTEADLAETLTALYEWQEAAIRLGKENAQLNAKLRVMLFEPEEPAIPPPAPSAP